MIDIHTHILHACDDGSPDLETSLTHIKMMKDAGVAGIVLSPHYMMGPYQNTAEIFELRFNQLKKALQENDISIQLYKAFEIYLEPNTLKEIKNKDLSINGTKYVLVETGFHGFPKDFMHILYDLVINGFYPILAHPERYPDIFNNSEFAEDLIHRNIYFQLNAASFIGLYGKKIQQTAWNLLKNGHCHFVASDNHCNFDEYILPQVLEKIEKTIDKYTVELLTEINPQKMLKNEKIDFFYVENIHSNETIFIQKFKNLFKRK